MLRRGAAVRVICPGGMMSCFSTEALDIAGFSGTDAHTDGATMARVAAAVAEACGFDNVGVPFCMTIEAEELGALVDLGDATVHPIVTEYPALASADLAALAGARRGFGVRASAVLEALSILAAEPQAGLVTGNVTGPMSVATSLVEPWTFYQTTRTDPSLAADVLMKIAEHVATFAAEQVRAGADVVFVSEPSATGDILGPVTFERLMIEPLRLVIGAIRSAGGVAALHICGDSSTLVPAIRRIGADAFSFDSCVSASGLREAWPDGVLVGNVSTQLLETGKAEVVRAAVASAFRSVDIIAPACGIGPGTPIANLKAMSDEARGVADTIARRPPDGVSRA